MKKSARLAAAALAVPVMVVAWASPAAADHVHFRYLGNGQCVLLAPDGGEKDVQLPRAEGPENRRLPLHVNVHLGRAGDAGQTPEGSMHSVFVAYAADGVPTAAAMQYCDGRFVNR